MAEHTIEFDMIAENQIDQLIQDNNTYKSKLEDISKELKLYKERELEAFLVGDALYDGIYIIDRTGTITARVKVSIVSKVVSKGRSF